MRTPWLPYEMSIDGKTLCFSSREDAAKWYATVQFELAEMAAVAQAHAERRASAPPRTTTSSIGERAEQSVQPAQPESHAQPVLIKVTSKVPESQAHKCLRLVLDAGKAGIASPDLAKALGYQGGRGLGPFTATLKRDLARVGFENVEDVREIRRGSDHGLRWYPAAKIEAAMAALQGGER